MSALRELWVLGWDEGWGEVMTLWDGPSSRSTREKMQALYWTAVLILFYIEFYILFDTEQQCDFNSQTCSSLAHVTTAVEIQI